MSAPNVLVLSGYGLNSEAETLYGFTHCGAAGDVVHINDLVDGHKRFEDYQILAIPGGFSFGDDTGSGNAYANRLRNHLWEPLLRFIEGDRLVIGICNGAQILANLGIVPAIDKRYGTRQVALRHNASGRYECRWVDLKVNQNNTSPWLAGLHTLHIPVSHGEGNFYLDDATLAEVKKRDLIAMQYTHADGSPAGGAYPASPNAALEDIAALTDETGRILQIMPHPERGMLFTQRDDWPRVKETYTRAGEPLPVESDGMGIFRNAVRYFVA